MEVSSEPDFAFDSVRGAEPCRRAKGPTTFRQRDRKVCMSTWGQCSYALCGWNDVPSKNLQRTPVIRCRPIKTDNSCRLLRLHGLPMRLTEQIRRDWQLVESDKAIHLRTGPVECGGGVRCCSSSTLRVGAQVAQVVEEPCSIVSEVEGCTVHAYGLNSPKRWQMKLQSVGVFHDVSRLCTLHPLQITNYVGRRPPALVESLPR